MGNSKPDKDDGGIFICRGKNNKARSFYAAGLVR